MIFFFNLIFNLYCRFYNYQDSYTNTLITQVVTLNTTSRVILSKSVIYNVTSTRGAGAFGSGASYIEVIRPLDQHYAIAFPDGNVKNAVFLPRGKSPYPNGNQNTWGTTDVDGSISGSTKKLFILIKRRLWLSVCEWS